MLCEFHKEIIAYLLILENKFIMFLHYLTLL